jgi:serine/threonine protein kinase
VKLENILVTNEKLDETDSSLPVTGIKIIDFGFAIEYAKGDKSTTY